MFTTIILGLLAITSVVLWLFERPNNYGEKEAAIILSSVGGVIAGICLIWSMVVYTGQVGDIETITAITEINRLNTIRVESLTAELKSTLTQAAPKHELEVFNTMSQKDILVYLAAYPQLKANESILKFSEQIVSLTDEIQRANIQSLELRASIRANKRNIFIPINYLLPTE